MKTCLPIRRTRQRGFTLIELMAVVAIVAILAAVALPSYAGYLARSRIPEGLMSLTTFSVRLEQHFQDSGTYAGDAGCAIAAPVSRHFQYRCETGDDGHTFRVVATGVEQLAGYGYSIDQNGTRKTEQHPKGVPVGNCWSLKGVICDI